MPDGQRTRRSASLLALVFVAVFFSGAMQRVLDHHYKNPSPVGVPAGQKEKLRILCLHGYHGNASILRSQMGALASAMSPYVELVQVDAPSHQSGDFGWWHAVDRAFPDHRGDPGVVGHRQYRGWDRTVAWTVELFTDQGPFDGVFGFSQGAAVTGLLVGLRAPDGKPTPERPLVFDFAIMVGGFPAADPDLAEVYRRRKAYDLPSVHIIGRSDGIVAAETSRRLASLFKEPTVLEHGGGHVVANTTDVRNGMVAFLQQRLAAKSHVPSHGFPQSGPMDVPLWPNRRTPAMRVIFPDKKPSRPAAAMVIFRGGAYATSAGSGGGTDAWLADKGIVGVTVDYGTRETSTFYPDNYADGARAVRLVKANAASWGIDPHRVGLLGYSAGGSLAAIVGTQPDHYAHPDDDLARSVSARPDLLVLCYGVLSFRDGYRPGAYVSSVDNFFGHRDHSQQDRNRFSSELRVTADTPPAFVWTTRPDALVPWTQSRLLEKAGVPVEFRLFEEGSHGLGLATGFKGDAKRWTFFLLQWLADRGFLD